MAERYRIRDDPRTGWTLEWGSGRAGGLTGTEWISIQTNMSQAGAEGAIRTIRDRGGSVDYPQELQISTTGFREAAPAPTPTRTGSLPMDPGLRSYVGTGAGGEAPVSTGIGSVPPLNPDDYYWKWDDLSGQMIPAKKGEPGATFSSTWWDEANASRANVASGYSGAGGGGGPTGPTAAELAIQQSQVDATNLATFISGTIAELEAEIDAGRLETEQAIGEFNRRLDAFSEAGKQFREIQPYTIPKGAEYAPGFQPGGIGERLGIEPVKAHPIKFDPFAMATDIVNETPVLTDIGVPSGDALKKAVELARGFIG